MKLVYSNYRLKILSLNRLRVKIQKNLWNKFIIVPSILNCMSNKIRPNWNTILIPNTNCKEV